MQTALGDFRCCLNSTLCRTRCVARNPRLTWSKCFLQSERDTRRCLAVLRKACLDMQFSARVASVAQDPWIDDETHSASGLSVPSLRFTELGRFSRSCGRERGPFQLPATSKRPTPRGPLPIFFDPFNFQATCRPYVRKNTLCRS